MNLADCSTPGGKSRSALLETSAEILSPTLPPPSVYVCVCFLKTFTRFFQAHAWLQAMGEVKWKRIKAFDFKSTFLQEGVGTLWGWAGYGKRVVLHMTINKQHDWAKILKSDLLSILPK